MAAAEEKPAFAYKTHRSGPKEFSSHNFHYTILHLAVGWPLVLRKRGTNSQSSVYLALALKLVKFLLYSRVFSFPSYNKRD